MLKYTKDHEWVRLEADETAVIGITNHAQDALGDLVYVELPEVGKNFRQEAAACVIESVKAAAEVKMPLSGEVVEVNAALSDTPALVNQDPLGAGWFIKIKPSNLAELDQLMDETAYQKFVGN